MILTIVFLVITLILSYLAIKSEDAPYRMLALISCSVTIFLIVCLSFSSINYKEFLIKRHLLVLSLDSGKTPTNQDHEISTINKNVIKWNYKLVELQSKNETFLFDDFVDDRITQLQPIK